MDNITKQYKLEEEMLGMGVEKFRADLLKAKEEGRETSMPAAKRLMQEGIEPLAKRIREFIGEAKKGKGGNRNSVVRFASKIPADQVAFLTLKIIFDNITVTRTLQGITTAIGQSIQDQMNLEAFQKENKALFKTVSRDLNKRARDTRFKKNVYRHSANKAGVVYEDWSRIDKHQLGIKLVDLACEVTGFFEIQKISSSKPYEIAPTQKVLDWMTEANFRCELMSPFRLPMVARPRDWTNTKNGGYYSKPLQHPMIKSRNKNYLRDLDKVDMPEVYTCINHLQGTGWAINKKVYDVLEQAMRTGGGFAQLPKADNEDLPIQPAILAPYKEVKPKDMPHEARVALTEWKKEAAKVYTSNASRVSKYLSLMKAMWVAERYLDEDEFFFTYQYDFRSRIYPVQKYLQPQGSDTSKALLKFSEGKAIENEEQAAWLAIHGANVFGFDKATLQERATWAVENLEDIKKVVENPFSHTWWTKADKPWQFLAFCYEFAEMYEQGLPYVSHLPIATDATCSGIQHFSAILRDAEGGEAVNLLPNEKRQDIYQRVADVVTRKLEEKGMLDLIKMTDRSLVKQNVMTLPYGATRMGMRDQIVNAIKDRVEKGKYVSDKYEMNEMAGILSELSYEAIGEVVVGARHIMDYLQDVAKVASKEKLPIQWITPVGFPVRQEYKDVTTKTIQTILQGGLRIQSKLAEGEGKLNSRRQSSGISPNFVHSMDAAMLIRTVNKAHALGINSMAMVHDSYGAHASDTPAMFDIIRQAFVEVHTEQDTVKDLTTRLLLNFKNDDSELPKEPSKGTLDLAVVNQSEFFFS